MNSIWLRSRLSSISQCESRTLIGWVAMTRNIGWWESIKGELEKGVASKQTGHTETSKSRRSQSIKGELEKGVASKQTGHAETSKSRRSQRQEVMLKRNMAKNIESTDRFGHLVGMARAKVYWVFNTKESVVPMSYIQRLQVVIPQQRICPKMSRRTLRFLATVMWIWFSARYIYI